MIRLNLGSGEDYREEYINCDIRREASPDVVCDVKNLPFPNKYVDVIVAQDLLEHFKSPVEVLEEWYRVLKKEGELWLRVPDFDKIINRNFIESTPFWRTENRLLGGRENEYDIHKSLFTKEVLEKRLRKAGFEEIKIKQFRTRPVHWHLGARAKKI